MTSCLSSKSFHCPQHYCNKHFLPRPLISNCHLISLYLFTVYLILLQSLCLMVNLTHECVPTCLALLHCLLQPWVTFSKAQQKIQPRNLAIWQDGFGRCGYQSSLSLWDVLRVSSTVSESINKSWVAESQTGYEEWKRKRGGIVICVVICCYFIII